MANHPSADKRNRQRIKRTARNRAVKGAVRTTLNKARIAVAEGDKKTAASKVKSATQKVARAASKGVLHRRAASRMVSRLEAALSKMGR
jgi:small subunit ribosomal protein S20